ncbi:MAG: Helix-turn-helix domain protein [Firmicutes bacterium ADurb.Bin300]|nr:MAG: Helix-turn-helix domain protein [Firmicutes bacterium ADurb.Bin300]
MPNFNLKAERVRRNLTQKDMAKLLNISIPAYNLKENSNRAFSHAETQLIAKEFQLTADEIKTIFFGE